MPLLKIPCYIVANIKDNFKYIHSHLVPVGFSGCIVGYGKHDRQWQGPPFAFSTKYDIEPRNKSLTEILNCISNLFQMILLVMIFFYKETKWESGLSRKILDCIICMMFHMKQVIILT